MRAGVNRKKGTNVCNRIREMKNRSGRKGVESDAQDEGREEGMRGTMRGRLS